MKNFKNRKAVAGVLAGVTLLGAIGCASAFFTDTETQTVSANAGTAKISMVDSSALDSDSDGILNPGDTGKLAFAISNDGEKSMDLKVVAKLTSTVPMTADAYEYNLEGLGTPEVSADMMTLTYTADLGTLNGSIEVEDGISITSLDKEYVFNFEKAAKNAFQDSDVTIDYTVYAKQHRNTEDADWNSADTLALFEHID